MTYTDVWQVVVARAIESGKLWKATFMYLRRYGWILVNEQEETIKRK